MLGSFYSMFQVFIDNKLDQRVNNEDISSLESFIESLETILIFDLLNGLKNTVLLVLVGNHIGMDNPEGVGN